MASTFSIFASFFCCRGKRLLPWPKMAWVLCCWNAPTAMIWRLMSFLCKSYAVFSSLCIENAWPHVFILQHIQCLYCNMRMTRNGLLTVMCVMCNVYAMRAHNAFIMNIFIFILLPLLGCCFLQFFLLIIYYALLMYHFKCFLLLLLHDQS